MDFSLIFYRSPCIYSSAFWVKAYLAVYCTSAGKQLGYTLIILTFYGTLPTFRGVTKALVWINHFFYGILFWENFIFTAFSSSTVHLKFRFSDLAVSRFLGPDVLFQIHSSHLSEARPAENIAASRHLYFLDAIQSKLRCQPVWRVPLKFDSIQHSWNSTLWRGSLSQITMFSATEVDSNEMFFTDIHTSAKWATGWGNSLWWYVHWDRYIAWL